MTNPEPTGADVEAYSQGRLEAEDARTGLLLASALAAARAYCGWHVVPDKEGDVLTLDGPGSSLLVLPTLRLINITAMTEDGVDVDLDTVEWSARGLVVRSGRTYWTRKFRGIQVTIDHGYESAPDWSAAVLSAVDRIGSGGREVVGPFQFQSEQTPTSMSENIFSAPERSILDLYRLERQP